MKVVVNWFACCTRDQCHDCILKEKKIVTYTYILLFSFSPQLTSVGWEYFQETFSDLHFICRSVSLFFKSNCSKESKPLYGTTIVVLSTLSFSSVPKTFLGCSLICKVYHFHRGGFLERIWILLSFSSI